MDFNKLSFYNSVLEFFAVILPGFVVTLILVMHHWDDVIVRFMVDQKFQTFYFNLVFLLLSYVVGQGLFQLGSIIDKLTYDRFNKFIYIKENDNYNEIISTRKNLFEKFDKSKKTIEKDQFAYLNNFQWCIAYLRQNDQPSFSEIEKIVADSKFFRSIFGATLLYIFSYDLMHELSNLGVTIILLIVLYISFYIFIQLCLEHINILKSDSIKTILNYCWLLVSSLFYLWILWIFYCQSKQFSCLTNSNELKILEICGEYNLYIVIINLLSLLLYFRIRKKSTKKAYQHAVYNLKLNVKQNKGKKA